jgi:hypothetical protein
MFCIKNGEMVAGAERWWRENEIRDIAGKSEIQGNA